MESFSISQHHLSNPPKQGQTFSPRNEPTMSSTQPRYGGSMAPQHTRNYSNSSQHQLVQQPQQLPAGYAYDSTGQNSQIPSLSTPHSSRKQELGIDDGDVTMEDADPYNRTKYPSRPSHSQRGSTQYLTQEESAAARRYSPMNTFSPTSPYPAGSPQQSNNSYNAYTPPSQSARQSPSRSNAFSTPSQQYYPSNGSLSPRQQHTIA